MRWSSYVVLAGFGFSGCSRAPSTATSPLPAASSPTSESTPGVEADFLRDPPDSMSAMVPLEPIRRGVPIRLSVVCENEELHVKAERACERGLESLVPVDFVHDNFSAHVHLAVATPGDAGADWIAVSLCVVPDNREPNLSLPTRAGMSTVLWHDIKICKRSDFITTCEALGRQVANWLISPLHDEAEMLRSLRAGETDQVNVDAIKDANR
jgi:hypothetical protein